VTVLPGVEANISRLQQLEQTGRLGSFTTLHIATHGLNVDSDTPMESYLLLYDSILEGLEIANWRLGAELVVLSACCSGQRAIKGRGMDELPGDDLFGLQAAFFAAGARWVLGSLWPVHSGVARTMMTAFHRLLLVGQAPDVALQSAIIEYLSGAGLRMRKSFFWAPFFLSAVGRPCGTEESEPALTPKT
jgi:CHAT domain-containing protein